MVSPLGETVERTWEALLAGRYITDHARVSLELSNHRPRVSQLAILAAHEAIASTAVGVIDPQAALVVGTSKGPIEDWLKPPSRLSDVQHPADFGLAGPASDIARELGITGPRLTLSAACASGLHALIRGAMLIQSGEARRVLVVAAESSVHPLFLASFDRLGVLPSPGIGCRPFDRNREGFLMSEAAAAVYLEAGNSDFAGIAVDRFAMGADASHLTASDVKGLALGRILEHVSPAGGLDLIHAHGTGTLMNDSIELATIERTITEMTPKPSLYSHKGALGHSLGAAGLVSVVINVMCHRHGVVPPNIRTTEPMAAEKVVLSHELIRRRVQRSVALAAGFGGPLAAVSLVSRDISMPI